MLYFSFTMPNSNTGFGSCDGMSQADLITQLSNNGNSNIQFLDQSTWQTQLAAWIAANPPTL